MIIINKEGYHYFPCDVVSTKDWELTMKSDTTKYVHTIFGDNNITGDYYKIWFNWDDIELMGNGEFNYDLKDTDGIALSKGVLRIDVPEGEFAPERSGDYVVYETNMDGYLTTQEGDCTTCYNMGYMEGIGKADYMYFKALTNGAVALINYNGNQPVNLRYSFDKRMWTPWYGEEIVLKRNAVLYVYADRVCNYYLKHSKFVVTGDIDVHGKVRSLSGFKYELEGGEFAHLFEDCDILTAPEFDFTKIGDGSCDGMFKNTKRLKQAPYLPTLELGEASYREMFMGSAIEDGGWILPAEYAHFQTYYAMYRDCKNLINVPAIMADNDDDYPFNAFGKMFYGCPNVHYITTFFTSLFAGFGMIDASNTNVGQWWNGGACDNDITTSGAVDKKVVPDNWEINMFYRVR